MQLCVHGVYINHTLALEPDRKLSVNFVTVRKTIFLKKLFSNILSSPEEKDSKE
jgi:hypothetical protein